jgi:hypothetical protein
MVASTQNGRLLLYDARKYDMGAEADHLGASGTCLLNAQVRTRGLAPTLRNFVLVVPLSSLFARRKKKVCDDQIATGPGWGPMMLFLSPSWDFGTWVTFRLTVAFAATKEIQLL